MINYQILADSCVFYEKCGFKRIESPWTVTEEVLNITKPPGAKDAFRLLHDNNKGLVASGEQSFLYLYLKGFLPKGKFQTITPCYRFENFDTFHSKYFIKNELIVTDITSRTFDYMIQDALKFFGKYLPSNLLDIKITSENDYSSCDIEYFDIKNNRKIELGSYGYRECDFLKWVYGTGVAENRLSTVINIHNKQ